MAGAALSIVCARWVTPKLTERRRMAPALLYFAAVLPYSGAAWQLGIAPLDPWTWAERRTAV
jgi:hypothetical protein